MGVSQYSLRRQKLLPKRAAGAYREAVYAINQRLLQPGTADIPL